MKKNLATVVNSLNNEVKIAPVHEDIIRCRTVMFSISIPVRSGMETVSVGTSLTAATFIVTQYLVFCSMTQAICYHPPRTTCSVCTYKHALTAILQSSTMYNNKNTVHTISLYKG